MSDPVPSIRLEGDAILSDSLVRELMDARLVCVFATFDVSGTIHAVPMWNAPRDGWIVLSTGSRSRKVRNLEADPRATVVLHDSRPGFEVCGASIVGEVEIVKGAGARDLVDLVHVRYVDRAAWDDSEVAQFLASDDVALLFRPRTALTWDERGGSAAAALRARGGALPLEPTEPRP